MGLYSGKARPIAGECSRDDAREREFEREREREREREVRSGILKFSRVPRTRPRRIVV